MNPIFKLFLLLLFPSVVFAQADDAQISFIFNNYFYNNCNEVKIYETWDAIPFNSRERQNDKLEVSCGDKNVFVTSEGQMTLKIKVPDDVRDAMSNATIENLLEMFKQVFQSNPDFEFFSNSSDDYGAKTNIKAQPSTEKCEIYHKKDPTTAQQKQIREDLFSYLEKNCVGLRITRNWGILPKEKKEFEKDSDEINEQKVEIAPNENPFQDGSNRNLPNFNIELFPKDTYQPSHSFDNLTISCDGVDVLSSNQNFATVVNFGENATSAAKVKSSDWVSMLKNILRNESEFKLISDKTRAYANTILRDDGGTNYFVSLTFEKPTD